MGRFPGKNMTLSVLLLLFYLVRFNTALSIQVTELPGNKVEITIPMTSLQEEASSSHGRVFSGSLAQYLALGACRVSNTDSLSLVRITGSKILHSECPKPFLSYSYSPNTLTYFNLALGVELASLRKIFCEKLGAGYLLYEEEVFPHLNEGVLHPLMSSTFDETPNQISPVGKYAKFVNSPSSTTKISAVQAIAHACGVPFGARCLLFLGRPLDFISVQLIREGDGGHRLRCFRRPSLRDSVWNA